MIGGGRQPGVSPVLQGGDTGGPVIQLGVLGSVRRNDAGGGGHLRGVSKSYQREVGTVTFRWDLVTPAAEEVLQVAGMQLATNYVGCWQVMVAQWVALHPLLGVSTR